MDMARLNAPPGGHALGTDFLAPDIIVGYRPASRRTSPGLLCRRDLARVGASLA